MRRQYTVLCQIGKICKALAGVCSHQVLCQNVRMTRVLAILSLLTCACVNVDYPVPEPCPFEWQPYVTVLAPQSEQGRALVQVSGPVDYVAPREGLCVYTQPDGTLAQLTGCYLADGYLCPR